MLFARLKNLKLDKYSTVFFILLALGILVQIDRFLLGNYAIIKLHDTFEAFWPYQLAMAQRLIAAELPKWNPDLMGGMPFLWMDINWLNLSMWISGLLPGPINYGFVILAQYLIASIGAFLFFQHFYKLEKKVCIFAGIIWGFTFIDMTYWRIADLSSIPLILYLIDRMAFERRQSRLFFLCFSFFICAFNITFAKGALFIMPFHLYFIFITHDDFKNRAKLIIPFALFWSFTFLINLPTFIELKNSISIGSRGAMSWSPSYQTLLQFYKNQLIQFFFSPFDQISINFGIVSTFIFIVGLFNYKKWPKLTKYLFLYFIAISLYTTFIDSADWYMLFRKKYNLVVEFRLSRFLLVTPFIFLNLIVVSIFPFIELLKKKSMLKYFVSIIVVIFFWKCFKHPYPTNFPTNQIEALFHVMLGTLFLFFIYKFKKNSSLSVKNILTLIIVSSLLHTFGLTNIFKILQTNPPSHKRILQSDVFDKFRPTHKYDYRIAFINFHPIVGVYNNYQVAGGYVSQYLRDYSVFWSGVARDKDFDEYNYRAYIYDQNVLRDTETPGVIKDISFNPELLALHNVKYVFSLNAIEAPERYKMKLVHTGETMTRPGGAGIKSLIFRQVQILKRAVHSIDYYVYEIENYSPRVSLIPNASITPTKDELRNVYQNAKREDYLNRIYYPQDSLTSISNEQKELFSSFLEGNKKNSHGEVKITSYQDNKIEITSDSKEATQLYLAENFHPDWRASVDGIETGILKAYGVFRSVLLPSGIHHIIFTYEPYLLERLYWISAFSCIIYFILACIFILVRTRRTL